MYRKKKEGKNIFMTFRGVFESKNSFLPSYLLTILCEYNIMSFFSTNSIRNKIKNDPWWTGGNNWKVWVSRSKSFRTNVR